MKIKRDDIGASRVKLTVSLDENEIKDAEQVALLKLSKAVKANGFRKGHAPLAVASKYVDPQQLAEASVDNAISRAVAEAFIEQHLRALDRPEVELTKYVPGSTIEFTAETDIIPSIKLGDYKKLGVKKPVAAKITKAEIDEVIERLRASLAEKSAVDRAAKLGDEVVIDFVGKKDGEPFDGGSATDYTLELGSKSFIPGFEEGLVGKKAGDHVDLKLKFPDDYGATEMAGKEVVFETDVKTVNEKKLPDLDDEFAKKTGAFQTLEELRADIQSHLTSDAVRKNDDEYRDQLVSKLVEISDIPTPDVLIKDQLSSIEYDALQNLRYQGRSLEDYLAARNLKDHDDWVEQEIKPLAIQRVQAGLALAEVSQNENITVSKADVDAKLEELRQTYANQKDMLKQLDGDAIKNEVENRLLTERAIDFLIANNK